MPRYSKKARRRSKFEDTVEDFLKEHGVDYVYEPKPAIVFFSTKRNSFCGECGSKQVLIRRTYTPDFLLTDSGIIIEVKGYLTQEDRSILVDVLKSNYGMDKKLRLLVQKDQWLTKKKVTRYSDWARQKGIECGVGLKDLKKWISESE